MREYHRIVTQYIFVKIEGDVFFISFGTARTIIQSGKWNTKKRRSIVRSKATMG